MSDISQSGRRAVEQARRGDFDGALSTAKEALARDPGDKGLRFFAGLLHSRRSEFAEAAAELRTALALAPEDPLVRSELVRVLAPLGELDEAEKLIDAPGLPPQDARRLRAMIAAQRGDHATAAGLYRDAVAQDPADFESWGKLGASLLASGHSAEAVSALERALQLRPGPKLREQWAEASAAAGTGEEALRKLYEQSRNDPSALLAAARLEDLQERPGRAIEALHKALEADPSNAAALVALADLQERGNRIDELETTVERLEKHAPSADELPLLRARAAYRRGDMALALQLAEEARPDVDPAARAQLIGQANDRLGNSEQAFEAFTQMNRIDALATQDPEGKAESYAASLDERLALLTPEWLSRWPAAPEPRLEPAFLIGFPRSGTTLLDTMLMNDATLAVSEENPMLSEVSRQIGAFDRIADLGKDDIERLRGLYFSQAERYVPQSRGRLLVDKFPFAIAAAPLIHRLFPGARIVFLSRHPCDVVLSCFMTRFQPTETGSAFLSLGATARLYDAMMRIWSKSRDLLPLQVCDMRYESLVEEAKPEMQRLAQFLGIQWSDELLDNRPAAARRGFIKTPSYSQVSEPIYRRALERWRNYSEELRPVIPTLEPWIRTLGYET